MANFNVAELQPNLTCLKNVDTLLRCPICFEFLNIPMMTKCSHNFCSLCIRKCLSYKLLCPVCNSVTTEQDLRNNRILDDLITIFQTARPQTSNAHFDSPPISPKTPSSTIKCKTPRMTPGPKKEGSILNHFFQKRPTTSSSAASREALPAHHPSRRGKRRSGALVCSQTGKASSCHMPNPNMDPNFRVSVKEEPMDLEILAPSVKMMKVFTGQVSPSTSQDIKPRVKVECPVCAVGISEQFINKHLDTCLSRGMKNGSLRSSQGAKRKPMGKLVYTLLSMPELKRRLKECHLSVQGNRDQMVRRHQEFVHMYNAQCDALEPKSAENIAKEVEANEKARNQLKRKTNRAMVFSKNQSEAEIDDMNSTYMKQHSSEFSHLIAQVRGRLETAKKMKPEMGDYGGGEGQGSSATAEAAVQEQTGAIPREPGAYCLLMSTPVKEASEEQQHLDDVICRSPSPCLSDISISSSISDVFAEKCFEVLEKASRGKRASCSREEDSGRPLVLGKRARKT